MNLPQNPYARRVDKNQKRIIAALRAAGASVTCTYMVGNGFVDIVVGVNGINYLLEIKDGTKPPSKRKLTPCEQAWHRHWRGQVAVVCDEQEALAACGLRNLLSK